MTEQQPSREGLRKSNLASDPVEQFRRWYEAAGRRPGRDSTAMTLATADRNGRPSARVVLLKSYDQSEFTFFTNFGSRKGRELLENPYAMLVFWWEQEAQQVRISGTVGQVDDDTSDRYFQSRPRGSQLGAWASPQSQPIPSREFLEERLAAVRAQYGDGPIPRPPHWGGFRLRPEEFEFWQGGDDRLHDRFIYRRDGDRWSIERLGP